MQKKHQITIITAQNNEYGLRSPVTKKFIMGYEAGKSKIPSIDKQKIHFNKFWKQEIFYWNNLTELYERLKPLYEGTEQDAFYKALMIGTFNEELKEPFGYRKTLAHTIDYESSFFILDIETSSSDYANYSLEMVRDWLIETYPFITQETGMILYHSASSGVQRHDGSDKDKQIRIRAIMEHTSMMGLDQSIRELYLRPYLKQDDNDFERHIDSASIRRSQHFNIAPPLLVDTTRNIIGDGICCLPGKPIDIEHFRSFDDNAFPSASKGGGIRGELVGVNSTTDTPLTQLEIYQALRTKKTEYWWKEIGDGNRNRGIFLMLLSAYYKRELDKWKNKLLNDDFKMGDKDPKNIEYIANEIRTKYYRDYGKPKDKFNKHSVTDIPFFLMRDWKEETGEFVSWQDKNVTLLALNEGAGKTESCKPIIEFAKKNNKTLLYICPNVKPVSKFCSDFNITYYNDVKSTMGDLDSEGKPIHKMMGSCLPSIDNFEGNSGYYNGAKIDIVIIDEIEQAIMMQTDSGRCIVNPEMNYGLLRQMCEQAEYVIGMDARISNLTLMAMEQWRLEQPFNIYTQSKVHTFLNLQTKERKKCRWVNSEFEAIEKVRKAVQEGKTVAITSELTRDGRKGKNLSAYCKYVEEATGIKGIAIDQKNKDDDEISEIINNPKILSDKLANGEISHMWTSPVLQSAWSYVSEEQPFDLVVGIYPSKVLNAPNIVQHICRFRQTMNYVMYIAKSGWEAPERIYEELYDTKDFPFQVQLETSNFNDVFRYDLKHNNIMRANIPEHFIEITKQRGLIHEFHNFRDGDQLKLNTWLSKNREKAWKLIKSKEIAEKYFRLKGKQEQVYDI